MSHELGKHLRLIVTHVKCSTQEKKVVSCSMLNLMLVGTCLNLH